MLFVYLFCLGRREIEGDIVPIGSSDRASAMVHSFVVSLSSLFRFESVFELAKVLKICNHKLSPVELLLSKVNSSSCVTSQLHIKFNALSFLFLALSQYVDKSEMHESLQSFNSLQEWKRLFLKLRALKQEVLQVGEGSDVDSAKKGTQINTWSLPTNKTYR